MGLLVGVILAAARSRPEGRSRPERSRSEDRDGTTRCSSGRRTRRTSRPTSWPSSTSTAIHGHYGKVLRTVPLDGAGAVGNEPHHVGLSRDGRTLALGGLLSVLRGQDQVFFFDVTRPAPSDVHPLGQSAGRVHHRRVRAAQRTAAFSSRSWAARTAPQPGRVVEYDDDMDFVQTWPATPPDDGFNPHGISIDEAHNLMVTSDFICPLRTLHVHGGSTARRARQRQGLGSRATAPSPRPSSSATRRIRPGRWRCS